MAGIFRKIFGGFSHGHSKKEEKEKQPTPEKKTPVVPTQQERAGGGFSVKVAVPADPVVHAPVVTQCNGNGGVQVSSDFSMCSRFLSPSLMCMLGYALLFMSW